METELLCKLDERLAFPTGTTVVRPIGADLFFSGIDSDSNLLEGILQNPKLLEPAEARRDLYSAFDQIFERVLDPKMDIERAMKEGLIEASIVVDLYDRLSDFLEEDENNRRILLYIPFEILPNLNDSSAKSDEMERSKQRLAALYNQAWIQLLHESDVRASFVDGDVLEPGLGKPERISKAGHLIPEILAKGIIKAEDIIALLEVITEEEIVRSIAEGTIVAGDKGLISESDWEIINDIFKRKLGLLDLRSKKQSNIIARTSSDQISPERARWLKKVEEEARIEADADHLSEKIKEFGLAVINATEEETNEEYWKIAILGIIKAGESFASLDKERAKGISDESRSLFLKLWEANNSGIRDTLISGLNHWARLGIIDEEFLRTLGIRMPDLSSPFPLEPKELSDDFVGVAEITRKIQEHPVLSQALYPTFIVFGSRIKGYASVDADFDAAMFFRPNVKFEDREEILETLKRDIPQVGNIDKILEYWTMLEDGKLRLMTPREDTTTMVGEAQIHFFMGGVWIGNREALMQIRSDMLERYLDLSRFGDQKEEVRRQLLGQIELDIVQYRLMHKGYRKLYPIVKRVGTQNSDLIDWESDFWDPGYRRIATKLFLSRVFLPDLS